jgi:hypothetical protein
MLGIARARGILLRRKRAVPDRDAGPRIGWVRVDLTRSLSRRRTTAPCAFLPLHRDIAEGPKAGPPSPPTRLVRIHGRRLGGADPFDVSSIAVCRLGHETHLWRERFRSSASGESPSPPGELCGPWRSLTTRIFGARPARASAQDSEATVIPVKATARE